MPTKMKDIPSNLNCFRLPRQVKYILIINNNTKAMTVFTFAKQTKEYLLLRNGFHIFEIKEKIFEIIFLESIEGEF